MVIPSIHFTSFSLLQLLLLQKALKIRLQDFFKNFLYSIAFFISLAYNMFKGTTAHKGLTDLYCVIELPPKLVKVFKGWFFYALNHYRQNVNMNVSNAKMNIPNDIKSLKSKCFISTTPILCIIK